MHKSLLALAKEYNSVDDFKHRNLPKYLIAKKHRLLKQMFPPIESKSKKGIKGIYYLYKDKKCIFIGSSTLDCIQAITYHKESTIPFNNYKVFQLASDADISVLGLYLANKYKPRYNTNIHTSKLSFSIEDVSKLLGKPIKGTK